MRTTKTIIQDQIQKRRPDPTGPQVKIVKYRTTRAYARAAPKMMAQGWVPSGQSQARAIGLRLPGKGIIVTWTKAAPPTT